MPWYSQLLTMVWRFGITHPVLISRKYEGFQNRAARICTQNFNYDIPRITLIHNLGWLNVIQRRKYLTGLLMFKCKSSGANLWNQIPLVIGQAQNIKLFKGLFKSWILSSSYDIGF